MNKDAALVDLDAVLTDKQCDEFRRTRGSFNTMIRTVYQAGRDAQLKELIDEIQNIGRGCADSCEEVHAIHELLEKLMEQRPLLRSTNGGDEA